MKRKQSDGKQFVSHHHLESMFGGKVISKPESSVAVKLADKLYIYLLKDTVESDNNSWNVDKYLKKLRRSDDCFGYRIACDEITEAPIAIVYQT